MASERSLRVLVVEDDAFTRMTLATGGPLLQNPHRVGKQLMPPMDDRWSARRGTYRIIYRIDESQREVTVVGIAPRADAYRTS